MGTLLTVIDYVRKLSVAKKQLKDGAITAINYKKIISKVALKYAAIVLAIIVFFGTLVYSITYAVKDGWDYLTQKYNTTNIDVLYEQISNMTDEDVEDFMQNIAFLNPKKILQYIDKQRQSVPSEITGTKTIDDDGSISRETVQLNVNELTQQYILPWQLVGSMDIITYRGLDLDDKAVINAANYAQADFTWTTDATSDETNYWKNWEVRTKEDSKKGTTVLYDGEDSAPEHHYTVKTPLALLDKVNTCFGTYTYDIKRDVVVVDEPYSKRQLVSKVLDRTEKVLDHTTTHTNSDGTTSTTKHYRTVYYYTYKYTKTRNTLIEDQMTGPTFTFQPNKFIQFLNSSGYSVKDLNLLKMTLESLPNTSIYLDMIDRIIEGNYGDLDMSGGVAGSIDGSGFGSGNIPLFHQWDSAWGNIVYGSGGTIATSGCGPTSAAMILTGLQGDLTGIDTNGDGIADPSETAAYAVAHGHRVVGVGTSWGYFADIGKKAGLNVRQYDVSQYAQVYEELKQGHPVIASMGPGHFTSQGHFIVLASVLPDGKIKVNDPNRQECSDTPWDFTSVIVPEARQFWAFDNPNRIGANFEATAYIATVEECGAYAGITANGTNVKNKDLRDKYIAVDTSVIPMNSKVYIEVPAEVRYQTMPDGTIVDMNGYYTAVDTGSAIKGKIVDIYFGPDKRYESIMNKFGRRQILIYK